MCSTRPSVVGAFASSKPPIDQSSENQTRWIDQGGRLDVPRLDIANAIDALASGSDTLIGNPIVPTSHMITCKHLVQGKNAEFTQCV